MPAHPFVAAPVAARWERVHGDAARAWLRAVPGLVAGWAARWDLDVAGPLEGGSMSVVVAGRRGGRGAVIKLAAPWVARPADQADALGAWAGDGAVELLERSADGAALLLERIEPGTASTGLTAEGVAAVVDRLASPPPPPGLPDMATAVARRFRRAGENRHRLLTPAQLAAAARAAGAWAARYAGAPALVHGDLLGSHLLLCARRGLMAVDPTPFAGDPAVDVALWALTTPPVEAAHERLASLGGRMAARAAGWADVLAAVEACLASAPRAEASLRLARARRAAWLEPSG